MDIKIDLEDRYKDMPHTVCRPRLRCNQLFMIYVGGRGSLMLHPLEFIRVTQIHDRNLIMFRDHLSRFYQAGLSPEIPGMSSFVEWQRSQRELYFPHVRMTYCLGTSAGAYGAIASGYFLKVPIVWAFAPPMTKTDGEISDRSGNAIVDRCSDLAELLRYGNGVTQYRIFYNESFNRDRNAAERLAGCPGVQLFPQPGYGHQVVISMKEMGGLSSVLVPFESVSE